MNVRVANEDDKDNWNDFVLKYSHYPCYLYEWRQVLECVYDYKCKYLVAEEQGEIIGVFPISIMRSIFFGQRLCSLPFSDYGGPLFSIDNTDYSWMDLFIDYLLSYINQADFLEIRTPVQSNVANCLQKKLEIGNTKYVTFVIGLEKTFDEIWRKVFDKYLRNAIRKAIKNGIKAEESEFEEKFDEFYGLYLVTMKKLGSPPHGKKFFRACYNKLGEKSVKLFLASFSGKAVGGVLTFLGKDSIYPVYEGISPRFRNLNPASLLFSHIIEWGCERGYKQFDFGRTLYGSGVYNFKKQWGGVERALPYYYIGRRIPHQDPREKYVHVANIWSKMIPLSLTELIGPKVKGGIGY